MYPCWQFLGYLYASNCYIHVKQVLQEYMYRHFCHFAVKTVRQQKAINHGRESLSPRETDFPRGKKKARQ